MADYWIADAQGRVLGPVGLEVLVDLLKAGRLQTIARVSRDGNTWAPVQSVPELAAALAPPSPERTAREKQEAARLRAQLEALRVRPAYEIFGIPPEAPLDTYRQAFFRLSKRFHPDSLPVGSDPELIDACTRAFRFLSNLMNQVESGMSAPKPQPAVPPAVTPAPSVPRYDAEEFIGLRTIGDQVEAHIHVTPANVGMFTDHPMMNLRQSAFFVAHDRVLRLGTVISLIFKFDDPPKTITTRGKVAWEDVGRTGSPRGFGVSLITLAAAERDFIRAFVERTRGSAGRR